MEWGKLKTLPIDEGHIDFDRFFDFINKVMKYDGTFTVEATAFNENGIVDIDMLNRCFFKIRQYIYCLTNIYKKQIGKTVVRCLSYLIYSFFFSLQGSLFSFILLPPSAISFLC